MIVLLSNTQALRKAVRDALAPEKVTAKRVTPKQAAELRADAVVTTSDISSSVARLAMRVGTAFIFVLPEAAKALNEFCADRPSVVLAGHDLGRIDSLVNAEARGGEQTVIL